MLQNGQPVAGTLEGGEVHGLPWYQRTGAPRKYTTMTKRLDRAKPKYCGKAWGPAPGACQRHSESRLGVDNRKCKGAADWKRD